MSQSHNCSQSGFYCISTCVRRLGSIVLHLHTCLQSRFYCMAFAHVFYSSLGSIAFVHLFIVSIQLHSLTSSSLGSIAFARL